MKKIRKGKKILLILLISIVVVVAAIFIIKGILNNIQSKEPGKEEIQQIFELPETTYSNMQVRNIQMEYLKDQDKTMVSFEIHNTTEEKVVDDHFDAILVGPNDNVLGQMQTWIKELGVGEQYELSVILKGDLTATTHIKLVKK